MHGLVDASAVAVVQLGGGGLGGGGTQFGGGLCGGLSDGSGAPFLLVIPH